MRLPVRSTQTGHSQILILNILQCIPSVKILNFLELVKTNSVFSLTIALPALGR